MKVLNPSNWQLIQNLKKQLWAKVHLQLRFHLQDSSFLLCVESRSVSTDSLFFFLCQKTTPHVSLNNRLWPRQAVPGQVSLLSTLCAHGNPTGTYQNRRGIRHCNRCAGINIVVVLIEPSRDVGVLCPFPSPQIHYFL